MAGKKSKVATEQKTSLDQKSSAPSNQEDKSKIELLGRDFDSVLKHTSMALQRKIDPAELVYVSFLYNWGAPLAELVNERLKGKQFVDGAAINALQSEITALKSEKQILQTALDNANKELDVLKARSAYTEDELDNDKMEVNYG